MSFCEEIRCKMEGLAPLNPFRKAGACVRPLPLNGILAPTKKSYRPGHVDLGFPNGAVQHVDGNTTFGLSGEGEFAPRLTRLNEPVGSALTASESVSETVTDMVTDGGEFSVVEILDAAVGSWVLSIRLLVSWSLFWCLLVIGLGR